MVWQKWLLPCGPCFFLKCSQCGCHHGVHGVARAPGTAFLGCGMACHLLSSSAPHVHWFGGKGPPSGAITSPLAPFSAEVVWEDVGILKQRPGCQHLQPCSLDLGHSDHSDAIILWWKPVGRPRRGLHQSYQSRQPHVEGWGAAGHPET